MNHGKYLVFRQRLIRIFAWTGFGREENTKKAFLEEHNRKYLPNELRNYIYMAHECSYWVGKLDVDYMERIDKDYTKSNYAGIKKEVRMGHWLENAMQPKKHSEYTQWLNLEMNLMDLEPLFVDNS